MFYVFFSCSSGKESKGDAPVKNNEQHECVDLGLSVKWATCNVGAQSPEDSGDYFAWGETEPKRTYTENNYKFLDPKDVDLPLSEYRHKTKYTVEKERGPVDNKTVLDPEDDVAHVKWKGSWRMPTIEEIDELIENCKWVWTYKNGKEGYLVISNMNANNIFLPASNSYVYNSVGSEPVGSYWSSTLRFNDDGVANYLTFDQDRVTRRYQCFCFFGLSVRPVHP